MNWHAVEISSNYSRVSGLNVEAGMEDILEPLDEDLVSQAIGNLLPDDEEELLAGISAGFNSFSITGTKINGEENEKFDLFSNLGGLEMDGEIQEGIGMHMNGSKLADGLYHGVMVGPNTALASEIGEHPSFKNTFC